MIDGKHINILTGVLVVLAVIFVAVFMVSPDTFGITAKERAVTYSSLFDEDTVTEIDITISEETLADILENPLATEYHMCDVTINGVTYPAVGIRTKGMTSLNQVASSNSDRYSFKLKADAYVGDQTFAGLQEFVINNVFQDATYMKEYLSYDLMNYIGVPTPLVTYATISINGEPFGLYVMIEAVEEDFAERNFGLNYGHLYKPETMNNMGDGNMNGQGGGMPDMTNMSPDTMPEFTNTSRQQFGEFPQMNTEAAEGRQQRDMGGGFGGAGFGGSGGGADLVYTDDELSSYSQIFDNTIFSKTKDSDKQRVVTALKNLNAGTDLETYVNVDEVLRYFAANTALVNLDSYAGNMKHNYYLYEDGNGQISILPWDFNLAFGAFQSGTASASVNFPIDTPVSGVSLDERPLIGVLLQNPEYLELYHSYLQEIADGYFASGYYAEKIAELDALIGEYVKNDATAFYTYDEYKKAIAALELFGELRSESIQGQLDGTIPSTESGQSENSAALVDASELNMNDMGSMGGGGGMGQDRTGAANVSSMNFGQNMSSSASFDMSGMNRNDMGFMGNNRNMDGAFPF